jgi:hypothetical protein
MPPLLQTHTTQPQEVVEIDWGNPITQGLAFVQAGPVAANLLGGPTGSSAAYGSATGTAGRGLAMSGAITGLRAPTRMSAGSGTALAFFMPTSLSNNRTFFGAYGTFGGAARAHFLSALNGQLLASSSDNFNWSAAQSAPGALQINRDALAVGRFRSGEGRDLWLNGQFIANDSTPRTPTSLDSYIVGFYDTAGSGDAFEGIMYLSCWWDRVLTDDEVRSISANPWQILSTSPMLHGLSEVPPPPRSKLQISAPIQLDRQPQEVVEVDWANPLTAGLRFAHVGASPSNLTGAPVEVLNGPLTPTTEGSLTGLYFDGSQAILGPTGPQEARSGTGLVVLALPPEAIGTSRTLIGTFRRQGFGGHYLSYEGSRFHAISVDGDGFALHAPTAFTAVANRVHTVAARFFSGAGRDIWLDGVDGGMDPRPRSPETAAVDVGKYPGSGVDFLGTMFLSCWWDRALSDSEMREVTANPWQLFCPVNATTVSNYQEERYPDNSVALTYLNWDWNGSNFFLNRQVTTPQGTDVMVVRIAGPTIPLLAVSYGGVSLTLRSFSIDANTSGTWIWELLDPPHGNFPLRIDAGSAWIHGVTVTFLSGIDKQNPVRALASGANNPEHIVTIPTEPGDIVLSVLCANELTGPPALPMRLDRVPDETLTEGRHWLFSSARAEGSSTTVAYTRNPSTFWRMNSVIAYRVNPASTIKWTPLLPGLPMSHTVGDEDQIIYVYFYNYDVPEVPEVSFGPVALGAPYMRDGDLVLWRLLNPPKGPNTLNVSGGDIPSGAILSVRDVDPYSPATVEILSRSPSVQGVKQTVRTPHNAQRVFAVFGSDVARTPVLGKYQRELFTNTEGYGTLSISAMLAHTSESTVSFAQPGLPDANISGLVLAFSPGVTSGVRLIPSQDVANTGWTPVGASTISQALQDVGGRYITSVESTADATVALSADNTQPLTKINDAVISVRARLN